MTIGQRQAATETYARRLDLLKRARKAGVDLDSLPLDAVASHPQVGTWRYTSLQSIVDAIDKVTEGLKGKK